MRSRNLAVCDHASVAELTVEMPHGVSSALEGFYSKDFYGQCNVGLIRGQSVDCCAGLFEASFVQGDVFC